MISNVPWRPAAYQTIDFIQSNNIAIKDQASILKALAHSEDDYIRVVSNYIRDDFVYPLQKDKDPSAGLCFLRYDDGCFIKKYYCKKEMEYAWGFPNETIVIKKGICIDTALLMTSLLLAGGIPAMCCLGAIVNVKDDSVAGYHAWSEFMYLGDLCADETTIHFPAETIIRIGGAYYKNSDWAKTNGIYYRKESMFNNTDEQTAGPLGCNMVALMGLPPQRVDETRVKCFGIQDTLDRMEKKGKAIAKEWRKSETIKHQILSHAFGDGR
jgi:hypothetical protein